MRIIHFADLHLGMENYGRLDPVTGLSSRVNDFLRALDLLVETAIEEKADMVLFAGDAFKNRTPSPTYQREFAKRIWKLAVAEQIPTFLLVGNHDVPASQRGATALDIFSTLSVPNITVARRPGNHMIQTKSGPVQIVALPWITRGTFLAHQQYHAKSLDEIEQLILDRVREGLDGLVSKLDRNVPTVFAFHGSVQGAVFGSERSVMLGTDIILPRNILHNPAFDYVALGHIHKHQEVLDDPPSVYPGSMERIDFGEAREPKGFVVVDFEGKKARWRFVDVHARPFVDISVDVRESDNPTEKVLQAIRHKDITEAVVRLRIGMKSGQEPYLDEGKVRQALAPAFSVASIIKQVDRQDRVRLGASNVEGMTPGDLLKLYLQSKNLDPDWIEMLMHHATRVFHMYRESQGQQ